MKPLNELSVFLGLWRRGGFLPCSISKSQDIVAFSPIGAWSIQLSPEMELLGFELACGVVWCVP